MWRCFACALLGTYLAPAAGLARDIASIAARASGAMRAGCAHVEPAFLAGLELEAARADMQSVLSTIPPGGGDEFESIETDLLDPAFRQRLPEPVPFGGVLQRFDELRAALAQCTGRRLLEGGGWHLMRYPVGSKFMRHVDEDAALFEPVRNSVSFLLYLTPDDWAATDGGALHVFEGAESSEPRRVMPVGGTLVVYDSAIEHEVAPTMRERHLISGRFKELDADWQQRGRRGERAWVELEPHE